MGHCSSSMAGGQQRFTLQNLPIILESDGKVTTKYRMLGGNKTNSEKKHVFTCEDINTKEQWVVKRYPLTYQSSEMIKNEIDIHKTIDSVHVVKIHEIFTTSESTLIVYEKAPGRKLFEALAARKEFDNEEFERIFYQLVSVMAYMHSKQIMLRSIDPSNILYDGENIKFISLSQAAFFKKGQRFKTLSAAPLYMSPEMVNGKYFYKTDVWSAGVIAFILLTGTPIVDGTSAEEIMLEIKMQRFHTPVLNSVEISPDIKNAIRSMLVLDPKARTKFKHVQAGPWYQAFNKNRRSDFKRASLFTDRLKEFNFKSKFLRGIHSYLVRQAITNEEKSRALHEFKKLDINDDGCIDRREFIEVLKNLGIEQADNIAGEIFDKVDVNKNGSIEYKEFLELWIKRQDFFAQENLKKYFNILDADKNGIISRDDLEIVFGAMVKTAEFKEQFKKYSKNNNMDHTGFAHLIRDMRETLEKTVKKKSEND